MELKRMFSLEGKTALVTGSSRGIGAAFAEVLAAAGANVAVHSTTGSDKAEAVAGTCRTYGVKACTVSGKLDDPAVPAQLIQDSIHKMGQIDILVLNASVQYRRSWSDFNADEVGTMLQVNFRASHEMMLAVLPDMQKRKWGRVVTVGSVQQYVPNPAMTVYAATKTAQLALVKNLAGHVAADGITVNNIAPGVINTDRNKDALANQEYREKIRNMVPAGFFGEPGDCAGALLLLCSDAGKYITGADLPVDGGMGLG